jgi:NTP pyrophosphatase (non-canonical NTP hydrolase)
MNQPTPQSDSSFQEINLLIWNFLQARDWHQLKSRGLATSISLEASELLEHYQWSDDPIGDKAELSAELADILIYCFEFAQQNDIDIAEAIRTKLEKANSKYPAEAFKGKVGEDRREAWVTAKLNSRKKGL